MSGSLPGISPEMQKIIQDFSIPSFEALPLFSIKETLDFHNKRQKALQSLNCAILFFELNELELSRKYLRSTSSDLDKIASLDKARIEELSSKLQATPVSKPVGSQKEEPLVDPVNYLPLINSSADEIAKCHLNRSVFLFENQRYAEGKNASQYGLEAKTDHIEIQQLLLAFFILNCVKLGEISPAKEKLLELTELCSQKHFNRIDVKLNLLILSASREQNREANAHFSKANHLFFSQMIPEALETYQKAFDTSSDKLLQFCALNNLVVGNYVNGKFNLEAVLSLGKLSLDNGDNTRFLFNLNFSSFYPVESALAWAKGIENSEFNPKIVGVCFYNLLGFLYQKKLDYVPSFHAFLNAYQSINQLIEKEPENLSFLKLKQIICQSLGSICYICYLKSNLHSNPFAEEKTFAESSEDFFIEANNLEKVQQIEHTIHSKCLKLVKGEKMVSAKTLYSTFPLEGLILHIPSVSLEEEKL